MPPPTVALALAGGNALGAYASGAYEALHERGYLPQLISGASIGAVTGGILAGNVAHERIARLREFWQQAAVGSAIGPTPEDGAPRELYNVAHALQSMMLGRPGLFGPRVPGALSIVPGMPSDVALFDNRPLTATLRRVIDFERLNRAEVALLVSAVDLETGETVVFDNRCECIEPLHFLASTGFTPAFPPTQIAGRCLADPGLVENLPLGAILGRPPGPKLLCFAVDLFDPRGARPVSFDTALERAQDIVFSAQTARALSALAQEHRLRHVVAELARRVPQRSAADAAVAALAAEGRDCDVTVVLVAYRPPAHEVSAKTLEYSRASIEERWAHGADDMSTALDRLERGDPTEAGHGFTLYDARHP